MAIEKLNTKFVTPEIVCSFPSLAEPSSVNGSAPKYGLSIPLPKNDAKALAALKQVMKNAAINAWGEKYAELKGVKHFVEDCDNDPKYEGDPIYTGCQKFAAKSKKQPGCVYANLQEIPKDAIADAIYAGCIIRASVSAYGTDTGGSKTVAFQLNNVMFVRDGERIGGASRASDDFADFKDDSFDANRLSSMATETEDIF
jgi:hypothetical protein